jgi:hypothetical protein
MPGNLRKMMLPDEAEIEFTSSHNLITSLPAAS